MKYARKRDVNEAQIVRELEAAGYSVQRLDGAGLPDLLVGIQDRLVLLEVKDGDGGVSTRAPHRRNDQSEFPASLTPAQVKWWSRWKGPAEKSCLWRLCAACPTSNRNSAAGRRAQSRS